MSPNQSTPSRPAPSPLGDHIISTPTSPRAISFAASASSPATELTTSSGRIHNYASTRQVPRRGSEGAATSVALWTDTREERLGFVQAELKKAQKRWSASQEKWLEEEHHLLELKRLHKKALKKEQATTEKAFGIRKSNTWGSRIGTLRSSRKNSAISINDDNMHENQEYQDNGDSGVEDSDSDNNGKDGLENAEGQEVICPPFPLLLTLLHQIAPLDFIKLGLSPLLYGRINSSNSWQRQHLTLPSPAPSAD